MGKYSDLADKAHAAWAATFSRPDETPCLCGRDRYSESGECPACDPEEPGVERTLEP